MPQAHRCRCLILNLLEQPEFDTHSVNYTTDREAALELLQLERAFTRIIQAVWEADPVQVLVRVYKLDITDMYQRGIVNPLQVGAFAYVIPSVPGVIPSVTGEAVCVICIDLVLPMGWVDSPIFFLRVFGNADRCGKHSGGHGPPGPVLQRDLQDPTDQAGGPYTPESLVHIHSYMYDVIPTVQGGADHQH